MIRNASGLLVFFLALLVLPGTIRHPPATVQASARALEGSSNWREYVNCEYGFEMAYPAGWELDDAYEQNYGKPPSGHQAPAYAGETRNLFSLGMEGPTQSQEGGGDFADGATVTLRITGTSGIVENWNIRPGQPWFLIKSTPADWVRLESSLLGGDRVEKIPVDINGFTGVIELSCAGVNPCTPFGEGGGAYRVFPNGRVLFVEWERLSGANKLSYQTYFLSMLSSFKLRK